MAGRTPYLRGAGPRGLGPVLGCGEPDTQGTVGEGQTRPRGPIHPELAAAFRLALSYGTVSDGRLVDVHRTTAWRWVQAAVRKAEELGAIPFGRRVGTHTLRHSYARHLLVHGIPINYLSRWLGHSSIQTTLIYLELVPDPTGSLAAVP